MKWQAASNRMNNELCFQSENTAKEVSQRKLVCSPQLIGVRLAVAINRKTGELSGVGNHQVNNKHVSSICVVSLKT